ILTCVRLVPLACYSREAWLPRPTVSNSSSETLQRRCRGTTLSFISYQVIVWLCACAVQWILNLSNTRQ
ncbi:hypothetical protein UPYG_G00001610, partial [Umbra pygmaea]